jgi:hypothetical protein
MTGGMELFSATNAKRTSQLVCAGAALFMVVNVWRAISPSPVIVGAATSDGDIAATISADLFAPDRTAPTTLYRIARVTAGVAPPVFVQPVVVIGTVINANGRSFAMCQLGAEAPRVVYVGQRIGTLTLVSVGQGSAVFTNETGARVVINALKAGS